MRTWLKRRPSCSEPKATPLCVCFLLLPGDGWLGDSRVTRSKQDERDDFAGCSGTGEGEFIEWRGRRGRPGLSGPKMGPLNACWLGGNVVQSS